MAAIFWQRLAVDHSLVVLGVAAGLEGSAPDVALSLLLGAFGSDFVFDFASDFASDADSEAGELLFGA